MTGPKLTKAESTYGRSKKKPVDEVEFESPEVVRTAMSRAPLDLRFEWRNSALRPGALDFLSCPSVGIDAGAKGHLTSDDGKGRTLEAEGA